MAWDINKNPNFSLYVRTGFSASPYVINVNQAELEIL